MEPLFPEENKALTDLATDLVAKSNALAGRLHPIIQTNVGDLVRSMNCYYSNLIEGHHTHPVDIDRALAGDYSAEPEKRNLQLEARAHIDVQRKIDLGEAPQPSTSTTFIEWVHKEFCQQLPEDLLIVSDPRTGKQERVIPGELRKVAVQVGRHIAPMSEDLGPLLIRFASAYGDTKLSTIQRIVGVAASHHRLLWIHPFADGNGRVARLFSHAFLKELGIGSSLWSVSRGLARAVDKYKAALQAADEPRRGDLDGRGNLTQSGLVDFCTFFLTSCVDQIVFMNSLFEPGELQRRIEIWCEEETRAGRLLKGSWPLLREALLCGEFARGKAPELTGYQERQARTVLNTLIEKGFLISPTSRSAVRLGFPLAVIDRWFPRLYVGPAAAT
ncbi:Fic family protein [Rhodopseudomonas palustris]|uniref:Fic family protein n=1 Tax=Rhodopseudomonas palustris TaxID=1076 RepID=UPI00115E3DF8|nr:Fic family protein [Rhodopseudomonas palustris]QDL98097.1 Fic family protein [Rhodopseudomonas palustris]